MLKIHSTVKIHPTAEIDVWDGEIGPRTIIEAHAVIQGKYVEIGTESWIGQYAVIGGGSCFDNEAFLNAGDWFHLGPFAHLNTARGVSIGDEVGIGHKSCVFTHGAYESVMDGFPVQWGSVVMGNRVWIPNAWVNPDVVIGNDVVVAAMSLVNRDLPSGCLAGGIPVRVLRGNIYPHRPSQEDRYQLLFQLTRRLAQEVEREYKIDFQEDNVIYLTYGGDMTIFFIADKKITGAANEASEAVKDQLRRNGVRFRYTEKDGEYISWTEAYEEL